MAELTYRDAVARGIAQEMERDEDVVFLGDRALRPALRPEVDELNVGAPPQLLGDRNRRVRVPTRAASREPDLHAPPRGPGATGRPPRTMPRGAGAGSAIAA